MIFVVDQLHSVRLDSVVEMEDAVVHLILNAALDPMEIRIVALKSPIAAETLVVVPPHPAVAILVVQGVVVEVDAVRNVNSCYLCI